jgi:hypothetical protein
MADVSYSIIGQLNDAPSYVFLAGFHLGTKSGDGSIPMW